VMVQTSRENPAKRKEIMTLLATFFGSDLKGKIQALVWYDTPNPLFGEISPRRLVQVGKADKVISFIKHQLGMD
jgi:hypothetical protein